MELSAKKVLEILRQKGIDALYHANTVQTACTFLHRGHLMARGVVAERSLSQTPQRTDESDRRYGLWYDVFLDGFDIHARSKERNLYGPVPFVFDIELLSHDWLSSLWITKVNPQNWKDHDNTAARYYITVEELQQRYRKHDSKQMFVLRHIGGVLRLKPYLKRIVVDDPHRHLDKIDAYSQAVGALRASARVGGLTEIVENITKRRCISTKCRCAKQYERLEEKVPNVLEKQDLNHLFAP